jgi:hypothetical protein
MSGLLIIVCADLTPLVAQIERAKDLFHWPRKPAAVGPAVLLLLVIILLVVLALRLAKRLLRLAKEPGPALALFAELARAHTLSPEEEKLLRRLARREKLSNPARLFVEKRYLEAYSAEVASAAKAGGCAESDTGIACRRLYARLFGPTA